MTTTTTAGQLLADLDAARADVEAARAACTAAQSWLDDATYECGRALAAYEAWSRGRLT